ncbi:MAG: hypothetical protein ABJF10_04735 [Chthoniobacter sp.]|uniref:hypothetical protein n=1 Tax=Chthoniobacter sp. TaxID=2510640 RepID=UPI0032A1DCB3
MFPRSLLPALLIFTTPLLHGEDFQGSSHPVPYDDEVIFYSKATPADPIAELQAKITRGEVKLPYDNEHGYLPALLDYFKIPASSQMLVFSKTSLQRTLITPKTPRALYFNDDVYIGYIPGAPVLEVSTVDPKLGGMFYHFEQDKVRHPQFVRDGDCLRCHSGPRTMGVPGHVMRSIGTDLEGEIDAPTEVGQITHCTPLEDRWAGWYVTGTHGEQTHRGNLIGPEALAQRLERPNAQGNLTNLEGFFDTKPYLQPGSDIVALMVLEHQAHMHNYITRLNYESQIMQARYGHIRYLGQQQTAFLRYLLFTEEARLTEPVAGTSTYTQDFPKMGPRDSQGRSLRDFDLQTRLFKYPCSFLIYSPAFDALPEAMHTQLLQRLYDILIGKDASPEWATLSAEDRHAILEILRETKPNLPSYWREGPAAE